ncbi:MAG: hypothetical protein WCJ09_03130 [Planctomycetota bacterium]
MSNRAIISMERIWQGLRVSLVVTVLFILLVRPGIAAESETTDGTDHPLLVITGASVNRILDRAVEVMQSRGVETTREEIFQRIQSQGDPVVLQDVEKWFDFNRPIGLMMFFRMESTDDSKIKTKATPAESEEIEDGDAKLGKQTGQSQPSGMEPWFDSLDDADFSRIVYFIPIKDFNLFLTAAKLTPVTGKPHCFRDEKGNESFARRIGDYVIAGEVELVENCPDPRSLSRSILGKNDVAASVQLKGLPPLPRNLGAEGIKAAFDASLQQRDDEPEHAYQLRRATGDLVREILELTVSHIDEINLGARLEPKTTQAILEVEFSGEKGGELSKFSAELTPRRLPFSSVVKAGSAFSMELALPLPERHAKPIAAAIRNYVATAKDAEASLLEEYVSLIEFGCKILDSRQLDLIVIDKEGLGTTRLMGIAVPGGPQFPQQFQQFLEGAKGEMKLELAVDELNGWPVHRLEIEDEVSLLKLFTEGISESASGNPPPFWIVATPQAVWLGSAPQSDGERLPEFMKTAIELHSKRVPNPQKNFRGNPLQMALHTRQWVNLFLEEVNVEQNDNPGLQKEIQEQVEKRKRDRDELMATYENASDELVVELQPSPTGWKLSIQLDEVYIRLISRAVSFGNLDSTKVPEAQKSE